MDNNFVEPLDDMLPTDEDYRRQEDLAYERWSEEELIKEIEKL